MVLEAQQTSAGLSRTYQGAAGFSRTVQSLTLLSKAHQTYQGTAGLSRTVQSLALLSKAYQGYANICKSFAGVRIAYQGLAESIKA